MDVRELRRFIRDTCCNHHDVDRCWPEPDGIVTCRYWREYQDGRLPRCKWLEEAVLPNDPSIEGDYCDTIQKQSYKTVDRPETGDKAVVKECSMCGQAFKAGSNRAQYCPQCQVKAKRERDKKASRNYRHAKRQRLD